MYIYIYTHIHTYIHTYIYTHTYIYIYIYILLFYWGPGARTVGFRKSMASYYGCHDSHYAYYDHDV